MVSDISFFEEFFKCNNSKVVGLFLDTMCLPKDADRILRLYYVDCMAQKEIADILCVEERTVRSKLHSARIVCKRKALGWFSQYFSKE